MKVSVICATYNQEAYIRSALEGFVNQKTSFDYEVLVHDDASTDNTANIVREYAERYPDIIRPIYQTENQYSQKMVLLQRLHGGWTERFIMRWKVPYLWLERLFSGFGMRCASLILHPIPSTWLKR